MKRSTRVRAARVLVLFAISAATSGWAATPSDANVTLGYQSLGSASFYFGCSVPCTMVPLALSAEGARVESPVNGAIVKWRFAGALNAATEYQLQVLKPGPGPSFTPTASSAPVRAAGSGVETFSTNLPIEVGDYIGVKLLGEGDLGAHGGGNLAFFAPPLGSEEPSTRSEFPYE